MTALFFLRSKVIAATVAFFLCQEFAPFCAYGQANQTKIAELAPGVFFRKAQTEPVFTGCNQGWVVFRDYVLIIDANFPGQADEVIASIRKTTDKPIRFVFDTHYHGDHADGNQQYAKIGATIIAQERSHQLFKTKGIEGFQRAKIDREKEYGTLSYELPSLFFTHKLIFDDGEQRVELIFFGHAHTAGDAVAWLPKHGILFTGDACVNGPFNYTGDANTESWINALGAMEELGVKTLCPGHGEAGGPEVIANQRRYFVELRSFVRERITKGDSLDTIKKEISFPFYKEWTGVEAASRVENIEHVYRELSAPKKPITDTTQFREWTSMPGHEGYGRLRIEQDLEETPADTRFDALADLYLRCDSIGQREIRDYFSEKPNEWISMFQYLRRASSRLAIDGQVLMLRRGLAIAAIEGARFDYRDSIVSLVLLRYAAEKTEIDPKPYFRQIRNCVASENIPYLDSALGHSREAMLATVRSFGPKDWAKD